MQTISTLLYRTYTSSTDSNQNSSIPNHELEPIVKLTYSFDVKAKS